MSSSISLLSSSPPFGYALKASRMAGLGVASGAGVRVACCAGREIEFCANADGVCATSIATQLRMPIGNRRVGYIRVALQTGDHGKTLTGCNGKSSRPERFAVPVAGTTQLITCNTGKSPPAPVPQAPSCACQGLPDERSTFGSLKDTSRTVPLYRLG